MVKHDITHGYSKGSTWSLVLNGLNGKTSLISLMVTVNGAPVPSITDGLNGITSDHVIAIINGWPGLTLLSYRVFDNFWSEYLSYYSIIVFSWSVV